MREIAEMVAGIRLEYRSSTPSAALPSETISDIVLVFVFTDHATIFSSLAL